MFKSWKSLYTTNYLNGVFLKKPILSICFFLYFNLKRRFQPFIFSQHCFVLCLKKINNTTTVLENQSSVEDSFIFVFLVLRLLKSWYRTHIYWKTSRIILNQQIMRLQRCYIELLLIWSSQRCCSNYHCLSLSKNFSMLNALNSRFFFLNVSN